jgi:hypothetical protein
MYFFLQLYFSVLLPYLLLCIIFVYDKLSILWVSALYGSDECSINTIQYNSTAYKMYSDGCTVILHPEYSVTCNMSTSYRKLIGVCSLVVVVHAEHLFFLGCFFVLMLM